jgi:D-glycero-alpha-D-manno-heptose-7-phosphate kinase
VEALALAPANRSRLEANLVLAFTGSAHDSATILKEQTIASKAGAAEVLEVLQGAHQLAIQARDCVRTGDLERFGGLLHEAWQFKKRFASGISNDRIDAWYDLARSNGALGGKIAGAGGGGFLMVYCKDDARDRVQSALTFAGLRCLDFSFESDGARVLFNAGLRLPPGTFTLKANRL